MEIQVEWLLRQVFTPPSKDHQDPLNIPKQRKVKMHADLSKVELSEIEWERFKFLVGKRFNKEDKTILMVSEKYPCRMMNQKHIMVMLNQAFQYAVYPETFDEEYEKYIAGNVDPTPLPPFKSRKQKDIKDTKAKGDEKTDGNKTSKKKGEWEDSDDEQVWDALAEDSD